MTVEITNPDGTKVTRSWTRAQYDNIGYANMPNARLINAQPNPQRPDIRQAQQQPAASQAPAAQPDQPQQGLPGSGSIPDQNSQGTPLTQGSNPGNVAGLTTDGKTPASGPWIRITPHDATHGDQLGTDIVRYDSQLGVAARQNNKPIEWIQQYNDSYGHPVPDDLNVSDQFQDLIKRQGYKVVSVDYLAPNTTNNPFAFPAYHATMQTPTGATGVFTFTSNTRTDTRPEDNTQRAPYMQLTGTPDKFEGGSTAQAAALQDAEAKENQARAALQAAQTSGVNTDNETKALELAEKQKNLIAYGTAVTNKDIQGQLLTAAQTVNTGVQSQVAAAGANNQSYNSALQYYRDQGNDEATAQRLAQDWYVNQAHIDNDNNTLVSNAGKSVLDNATAVRAQDVSLDNTRLNAATQGLDNAGKFALGINDYLKPGSTQGGAALAAMMGLQGLLAQKYGALQDYAHPDVPVGISGLANTPVTRLGQLPSLTDVEGQSQGMATGWGSDSRPQPPGAPNIQVPQAQAVGVKAGVNPSTAITPPAIVKPPQPGQAATPGQPAQDNSKNSPDDLLTLKDAQGNQVNVMRDVYEMHPDLYNPQAYSVVNAQANPYRGSQYRPDDILTLQQGDTQKTVKRDEWDNQLKRDPSWQVVNTEANPLRNANSTTPGQDTGPAAPTTLNPSIPKPSDAATESNAQPQRPQQPPSLAYVPTNQLDTSPSIGVQTTNNLLAQQQPQRQDPFSDRLFNDPAAIYGLFDQDSDPSQYI